MIRNLNCPKAVTDRVTGGALFTTLSPSLTYTMPIFGLGAAREDARLWSHLVKLRVVALDVLWPAWHHTSGGVWHFIPGREPSGDTCWRSGGGAGLQLLNPTGGFHIFHPPQNGRGMWEALVFQPWAV